MVFFRPLSYNFTVAEGFARSLRKREVWCSNPRQLIFFFKLFKSNKHWIEYQCSTVAISLIANLLQLKRWKALVALYKNKLLYNLTTFTFLTFWDPNKFSAFCALIFHDWHEYKGIQSRCSLSESSEVIDLYMY
jgi:hypothetical protein